MHLVPMDRILTHSDFLLGIALGFFISVGAVCSARPALADDTQDESCSALPALTAEQPILEYERHMMHGPDPGPRLSLYADGRVYVYFPAFLKSAGNYRLSLSAAETCELWKDSHRWGLATFDARATAEDLRRSLTETSRLVVPGAAWSVFRILRLGSSPGEPGLTETGTYREVRWQGLIWSSLAHPEHMGLEGLALAQKRLELLMHDPRLQSREDLP